MQFTIIVAVSAHVASVLLIGWMTIQLHRHLRRIEQRLDVLEHGPERVPAATRSAHAAISTRLQADTRLPEFPQVTRRGRTSPADEPNVRGTHRVA